LEQARPGAAPEAALQTWEGEGGAVDQGVTQPSEADAPAYLEIYLGSFNGPSYGLSWEGRTLVYESFEPGYRRREQVLLFPSHAQWRRFWRSMDRIGVWEWDEWYEPGVRFEPATVVRDGTYWSLTLAHAERAVQASGDNAAPGAGDLDESPVFARFCEAVARLAGGRDFA
jgi:hypothetical protein